MVGQMLRASPAWQSFLRERKALCMAGLAIDCARSDHWLERSQKILRTEVSAQVLPAGGHCERSPMYHSLVLEDVLDMLNLASAAGLPDRHPLVARLRPCVAPMLEWLGSMCHPDGDFAFFNHCALGIAPTLGQLEQYADRMAGHRRSGSKRGTRQLAASGFTRLVSGPWTVLLDTGSVGPKEQPAHAHAGTLSPGGFLDWPPAVRQRRDINLLTWRRSTS